MFTNLESSLREVRTSRTRSPRPDERVTVEPSSNSPILRAEYDSEAKDHYAYESHDAMNQSLILVGSSPELKLSNVEILKQSPQDASIQEASAQTEQYPSTATRSTTDDNESTSFMSDDEKMSEFDFDGTNYIQSPLKPSPPREESAPSVISDPKEIKSNVLHGRYSIGLDDSMIDNVCSPVPCHVLYKYQC